MRRFAVILLTLAVSMTTVAQESPYRYKGNLHTHTLWSDGDAAPEVSVKWYKDNGYDFLALSDHNILSQGEKWFPVTEDGRLTPERVQKLKAVFGADWVKTRVSNDTVEMRLKTLPELKRTFEEPGAFLLIQSEEITDRYEKYPVHVNGTNLREYVEPQGGTSVADVMQRNVDAVRAQRERTGTPMFAHINHPNFGWGIVAEDLIALRGDRFFEAYNGHPGVRNWGDDRHPSMDRMWDIALSMRLREGRPSLYGLATDDTHNYHDIRVGRSNAGRGWVMVNATELTPEAIVLAMERGDFYATSGVLIQDIEATEDALTVHIAAESGVAYRTQFVGTRKGFDASSEPIANDADEPLHISRRYSEEIGVVFEETTDATARYVFTGDELYVRAKVVSDKPHPNPFAEGDTEMAWTQPVVLGR